MVRAIILGAAGFIGNNVLRAALGAGYECVAWRQADKSSRAFDDLLVPFRVRVSVATGDVSDRKALAGVMRRCDVVFHCAGYAPPNSRDYDRRVYDAVQHITDVLEAARIADVGKVVYTSSWSTIGPAGGFHNRLSEESDHYKMGQVQHPYWDAKLIQEQKIMEYVRKGLHVVILNPTEVAGLYDFELSAMRGLVNMKKGRAWFYLPGNVCLVDVRDVAQAHVAAARRGASGERYVLGGHNITRREQVKIMARLCEMRPPTRELPLNIAVTLAHLAERVACVGSPDRPFRHTYTVEAVKNHAWYDSRKARRELGLQPRPLSETYRDALVWLEQMGK